MLRGLNIAKTNVDPLNVDIGLNRGANNFQIEILGRNVYLRDLSVTIVYIKNILLFNNQTSTIFHTRIFTVGHTGCTATLDGFGQCIIYDSSINVPSFKLTN